MPRTAFLVVGAIGARIRVRLFAASSGDPFDLTSATVSFLIADPDNNVMTKSASLASPPTDGEAYYDTIDGDLDEAGQWHLQVKVEVGGAVHRTESVPFTVKGKLD